MKTLRVGDKVRVVNTLAGHGQDVGSIFHFAGYNGQYLRVQENSMSYMTDDLDRMPLTCEQLTKRLQAAERETKILSEQIAFMEETKLDDFDDTEFNRFAIGRVLDNDDLTNDERASEIITLLSN